MTDGLLDNIKDQSNAKAPADPVGPKASRICRYWRRPSKITSLKQWLDAGKTAIEEQAAKQVGDEVDALVRENLENLYADELLAIISKAPETDKKYDAAWRAYCAWMKAEGVRHLPPRSTACARYLHELVEAGASEQKIKLTRAAVSHGYRTLGRSTQRMIFSAAPSPTA